MNHKEDWLPKNWCFWIVVLEKTLESPLDCKEINPVDPKGNQPWIFIGRTDAEGPILWPPDGKSWLIGKDPNAGKDWRQEKGMTEHEMVQWHHWFHGHEFEQTLGDSERQRSLVCCSPWNHKESEMIWCLSNNNRSQNTVNYSKGHFLCMWSTHISIMIFNWVWKTWKCAWQERTYKVFLIILNPSELYLLKKLLEYLRISSCFFQLSDL